jgi:hypothetical protein
LFRYIKCTTKDDTTDGDDDGDGDDDELEQDPDFEAWELAIENANKHCKRSICQHKLANKKIVKAEEDKMNDVPHLSQTYTWISHTLVGNSLEKMFTTHL